MASTHKLWTLGGAIALSVAGVASCTSVIGISGDFEDIATAYCACSGSDALFNGACASHVRRSLANDPSNAVGWLKAYVDEKCDQCPDPMAATETWSLCAAVPPVCYGLNEECSDPRACCGYAEGHASCINDLCTACSADGQACTASADCCGGAYCGKHGASQNICVRELPSCLHTGGFCTENADCCGYEDGGDANTGVACDKSSNTCVEHCQLSAPDNCPGCCLSMILNGSEAAGICGDGSPECGRRCDTGAQASCTHFLTCSCRAFSVPSLNACAFTCGT